MKKTLSCSMSTLTLMFLVSLLIVGGSAFVFEYPIYAAQPMEAGSSGSTTNITAWGGLPRYAVDYAYPDNETLMFYKAAKITILHWHGPFSGYDGLPSRDQLLKEMQDARRVVQKVHAQGMKILFYVSPTIVYGDEKKRTLLFDFFDQRWESYGDYLGSKPSDPMSWIQRDEKGVPIRYAWETKKSSYCLCPNSAGTRQYMRGLFKFVVECGADGVFFDGPQFFNGVCYCDSCKAKFKATHPGLKLPVKQADSSTCKITEPSCVEWQTFFADSLEDFLADMRSYTRSLNVNFMIISNYWTREPYATLRQQAADAAKWSKAVDILFCESDYETGPVFEAGKKYSNSSLYKFLVSAAQDKPAVMLKTSVKSSFAQGQFNLTKLCMAEAASNQAVWAFWKLDNSARKAAIDYNQFLADHEDLYTGWNPYAKVAVMSDPRQVYYGKVSFDAVLSRLLTDDHIMHTIVMADDATLQNLTPYKIIIIPQFAVMSETTLAQICSYVEKGGNALFLGKTATYTSSYAKRDIKQYIRQRTRQAKPFTENSATLGLGKIIFIPVDDLPLLTRKPLETKERRSLQGVLDSLDMLTPQARILEPDVDSSVEFTVRVKPGSTQESLAVHMVNYAVDPKGSVKDKNNLSVSVRLPDGFSCHKADIFSPDVGNQRHVIPFSVTNTAGVDTLSVSIPRLTIYNILLLNLVRDKNPGLKAPR